MYCRCVSSSWIVTCAEQVIDLSRFVGLLVCPSVSLWAAFTREVSREFSRNFGKLQLGQKIRLIDTKNFAADSDLGVGIFGRDNNSTLWRVARRKQSKTELLSYWRSYMRFCGSIRMRYFSPEPVGPMLYVLWYYRN